MKYEIRCHLQDELYRAFLAAPSISTVAVRIAAQQNPNDGWLNRVFANDSSHRNRTTQFIHRTIVLEFHLQTKRAHRKLSSNGLSYSLMFGKNPS